MKKKLLISTLLLAASFGQAVAQFIGADAVSYTHLDVYKRQH